MGITCIIIKKESTLDKKINISSMVKMNQYDIFISYRREGGFEAAKFVKEKLTSLGYRVFLDFEDLRTGKFNEKLYSVISECNDFVVIMSPNCLKRCENADDWLRLEIIHALENKKNIIPIMLRNFDWPDTMPSGMEELKFMNGITASDEFYDAYIKRLVSYLKSTPNIIRKFKKVWIVLALLLTTISSFLFFYGRYENKRQLEQVSNAVIGDIGLKMTSLNIELEGMKETSKKWAFFYQVMIMPGDENRKVQEKESLLQYIAFREKQLKEINYQSPLTDKYLDVLSKSQIPLEDVQAFYSVAYRLFFDELGSYYNSLRTMAQTPIQGWTVQTNEMMQQRERMVYYNAESLYYNILELIADMPETSRLVYNRYSAQLTCFPSSGKMGKEEARSAAEKSMNLYQKALTDFAALTGQAAKDVRELEKDVERLAFKQQKNETLKEEITTIDRRIKQSKANLLKKCQPLPDDDEWMIWGKMLRLLSVKMNNDAVKVLKAFEHKMGSKGENVDVYTKPVEVFILEHLGATHFGGVVAIGFENNKPHSCLKVGDIVVKVNGKSISNLSEMNALRTEFGKGAPISILRMTSDGKLNELMLIFSNDDPRVAYLNLMETSDKN